MSQVFKIIVFVCSWVTVGALSSVAQAWVDTSNSMASVPIPWYHYILRRIFCSSGHQKHPSGGGFLPHRCVIRVLPLRQAYHECMDASSYSPADVKESAGLYIVYCVRLLRGTQRQNGWLAVWRVWQLWCLNGVHKRDDTHIPNNGELKTPRTLLSTLGMMVKKQEMCTQHTITHATSVLHLNTTWIQDSSRKVK